MYDACKVMIKIAKKVHWKGINFIYLPIHMDSHIVYHGFWSHIDMSEILQIFCERDNILLHGTLQVVEENQFVEFLSDIIFLI